MDADLDDPMATLNDTARAFPANRSLPDLIAEQAAWAPDAPAVDDGVGRLTYAELAARADAVAARLVALGARPGDRIGVCLQRSVEIVAALLGVMRAGAAYVPLDPGYPTDRLALMAQDAGCALVLVDSSTAGCAPPGPTPVRLDEITPAAPSPSRATAQGLAYVIYTSGSTGRPKGVEVRHRSVVNLLCALQRRLGFASGHRWLAVTTISFDISVLEIFLPLVFGGCVVLAPAASDGEALANLVEATRPQVMQATPAGWRLLLAAGWRGDGSTTLLCGGEAIDPALARRLVENGGGRFWNVYGPTETTIWSTAAEVREVVERVPIGLPLDNTRLHVLDESGNPVAPGREGELCIGGEGVARGYHGRPELTAERFVAEPGRPGQRMYRTGDRVRLSASGEVEFLGRVDHQVKVRGFRIEPGEVEARLCEHPALAQAVVVAQPAPDGDARLVAYVVGRGQVPPPADLQAFAALTLPPYMAPDLVVALETLPLTPNGKVDRLALARLSPDVVGAAAAAPPRDDLERAVAGVFETVLGARAVGVDDDFFALGGTSLRAVRVIALIERRLGRRLHVNTLYHGGSTVAAIARVLRGETADALPHLLPLGARADDGAPNPIFCLHTLVEGTLFFYEALARRLGPSLAAEGGERLLGVLPRGLHDGGVPDADLSGMAGHCVAAIRTRQPEGPYRLLGYSSAGMLALETARRLAAEGEGVSFLGLIDAYPPVGPRTWRYHWALLADRLERFTDKFVGRAHGLIVRHGRRASGVDDMELRRRHRQAGRGYRPTAYPGEAALFVTRETLRMFAEPGLGWRRLVGGLSVDTVEGGHFSVVNEPNVAALAQKVRARLESARAGLDG